MAHPTYEELQAEIERLKSGNKNREVTFKVGDKGGVSVYGLGRFPVTLYKEQWEKLIGTIPALQLFMAENASKLKIKE